MSETAEQYVPPQAEQGQVEETTDPEAVEQSGASLDDVQVVPEQRPQAFAQPSPGSDSSVNQRLVAGGANVPHGKAEYDAANSEENKAAALAASRTPVLIEGTRVQITGGPDVGRMAFVQSIQFKDGAAFQLFHSPNNPEGRFAEVESYLVQTRDGRSDLLSVTPDQLQELSVQNGWGRGSI